MKRLITLTFMVAALFATMSGRELISINDGWEFTYGCDTSVQSVNLPHSWNSDAYLTRDYRRGTGVYAKRLRIPADAAGRRVYLKFDGAASQSELTVDGRPAGSHVGAYSPHLADVTGFVTPGNTHELVIKVNNASKDVAPYSADFTFMGGLYRDAWLMILPQVHLGVEAVPECGFRVSTSLSEGLCSGTVAINATMVNDSDRKTRTRAIARLYAPDGSETACKRVSKMIAPGAKAPLNIEFDNIDGVALWTPETPQLYRVEVELEADGKTVDRTWCDTGFRTFGFDDEGRFLLNGRPYKLRGMCRHQDQAPMGIALTDEQHRRDMRLIKEMGANFVRISHYPQDDAVVEMCDRLGLIAWEEIPVIDYVPESDAFADNCETMLRDMIHSHFNHPSIAMWGYMNEILLRMPRDGQPAVKARTLALARRLESVLADEDSTRMSTMAFHGSDVYHGAGLAEITDVKGWNLYQGWYGGELSGFEEFLSRQHREHPSHRLIVSEYGAGSDLRLHSLAPEPFDFSMEYQQKYLEHYLPVIEDSAFVAGASHWNFIDFSSANRAESMPHINNKGLVTNARLPKDVYYYYKAAWHGADTVAHIASRDWASRTELMPEASCVVRPIKVYTTLAEAGLRVNDIDLGVKPVANFTAVFDVPLAAGDNLVELYAPERPGKALDAMTVAVTAIPVGVDGRIRLTTGELAVNVGSRCYYRAPDSGLDWLPDREYAPGSGYGHTGGSLSVSQDEIALTPDGPLYQHCLSGLDEYRFDVADGRYEVELSFAELSAPSEQSVYLLGRDSGGAASRWTKMDVCVNGRRVEAGFAPGDNGVKTLVKRRYEAEARDGSGVTLRFDAAPGASTHLSAVKIRKL